MKGESDEEFNDELNDKLNELWTGAAEKRRELIRNKTPNYSRRSDISELNVSAPPITGIVEKQVCKLREKLQQEVAVGKHKDLEIDNLKKMVSQLANEKKFLLNELEQQQGDENCGYALNESSIHDVPRKNQPPPDSTHHKKNKNNLTKLASTIIEQQQRDIKEEKLENLDKQRLVELLRSTSEYRSFVFYYDSHELSYLKRLQAQHKKNCTQTASEKERTFWAPTDILREMKVLNEREEMGLNELQQELIISRMKAYFQRNEEEKLRKMRQSYEQKLKKAVRENQNNVPYDLVQICKAKERELTKQVGRKRNNTLTK